MDFKKLTCVFKAREASLLGLLSREEKYCQPHQALMCLLLGVASQGFNRRIVEMLMSGDESDESLRVFFAFVNTAIKIVKMPVGSEKCTKLTNCAKQFTQGLYAEERVLVGAALAAVIGTEGDSVDKTRSEYLN